MTLTVDTAPPLTISPKQHEDLSEHLFGPRSDSGLLDQTIPEAQALEAYGLFGERPSEETQIDALVLDEAHRAAVQLFSGGAKFSETGITLSPSSLRGYLPGPSARARRRIVLMAIGGLMVDIANTTTSMLVDLVPSQMLRTVDAPVREKVVRLLEDAPAVAAPPAYQAFKDLARWLEAEDGEVAKAVGIGRTTPYSWKRDGREPRADTVRRLYEYHATLLALHRRLGESGFRAWTFASRRGHREALLAGNLAAVERDVDTVLFGRATDRLPDLAWAPEQAPEAEPDDDSVQENRLRGRRPRRARLP